MTRSFKGGKGKFINRYKITGTLTTISPLHIGDGELASDSSRLSGENGDILKFSTVMTDAGGRAYIPGSTLKGNLRSWLTRIFTDLKLACLNDSRRADDLFEKAKGYESKTDPEKNAVLSCLSDCELLFGSTINEGKLEIWDAPMLPTPSPGSGSSAAYAGYDPGRGTMILKSVAINPVTGTAAKSLLFNYEAVPPGAKFSISIAGQSLSKGELGMLLFGLDGFNSKIYPVTLGANGSIGFGRAEFKVASIHCLNENNLMQWLVKAVENGHAGYEGLEELGEGERKKRIAEFRQSLREKLQQEGKK